MFVHGLPKFWYEWKNQLSLELLDAVLTVEPGHRTAMAVRANSLEQMGTNSI